MNIPECPPLSSLPRTNTSHATPDVILNTEDRYFGADVILSCPEDYHIVGTELASCLDTGKWSIQALPHCTDITYGIPESTKIYIGVFAGCGVLVILAFAVLIARIICANRRSLSERYDYGKSTESVASIRYFPQDEHFQETVIDVQPTDHRFDSFTNHAYNYSTDQTDRNNAYSYGVNQSERNHAHIYNVEQSDQRNHAHIYNVDQPDQSWSREQSPDGWRGRISSYDGSFDAESNLGYIVEDPDDPQRKWSMGSISTSDRFDNSQYNRTSRYSNHISEVIHDDRTPF